MDHKEKAEAVIRISRALGGVALEPEKISDDMATDLVLFLDAYDKTNVETADCHVCKKSVPIEEIGMYRAVTGIGHGVASHMTEISGSCCEGCYPTLVRNLRLAVLPKEAPTWTEERPKDVPSEVRCKDCGWQGKHARVEFSSLDPGFQDSYCPTCSSVKLVSVYQVQS